MLNLSLFPGIEITKEKGKIINNIDTSQIITPKYNKRPTTNHKTKSINGNNSGDYYEKRL